MQQLVPPPQQFPQAPTPAWAFPVAPAPAPASPVTGGGPAAHATVARVRWGRVLPVLAGVVLLAFGIWNATSASRPERSTVSAIGGGSGGSAALDITEPKASTTKPETTPSTEPAARPAAAPRSRRSTRAKTRRMAGAATTAATRARTARAATPRTTVARGGGAGAAAAPAGELPFTGLETWIAAVLGVLLLAVGICVHVNAVRIGMTAMLYRRGILLRPVDCARLAQERGLPQLRVLASNCLHRLLAEPVRRDDFVTARAAR